MLIYLVGDTQRVQSMHELKSAAVSTASKARASGSRIAAARSSVVARAKLDASMKFPDTAIVCEMFRTQWGEPAGTNRSSPASRMHS